MKARAQNRLGEKACLLDQVVKEIRRNGPMSSKDFKSDSGPKKRKNRGWWNWKPAKTALEMLYWAGILTVAYRENFQRYYDLTENVLPSCVDITEPSDEERREFYIEKTVDAWGIVKPRDLASYYYTWCTRTPLKGNVLRDALKVLVNQDTLEEVTIEGDDQPYYILTRDRETIQRISDGETGVPDKVTFLSPFDNLTWNKNRTKDLFSFEPKFEAYFPKEKRKFGYYTLNILYGDKLVGRLDPKMHRDKGLLEVKALRLEETFKPDIEFEEKLTESFTSFIKFHKAKKIQFRRISPLLKSWEKTVTLN